MKVIGIGDNVIDRYTHTGIGYPGGNALNFSVYAAMLGAEAAYCGVFGDDAAAAHIRQALAERQVDSSHCRSVAGENGYASLTIEQGERIFLGSNAGGVSQTTPMDFVLDDAGWLTAFAVLHTSAYSYCDRLLPILATLPGKVSYDFSDDFDTAQALTLCPQLDYAFFSCADRPIEETRQLLQDAHRQGCPLAIATLGARGALLFDGSQWLSQAPHTIEPVDTLGAGDAFITAFLLAHAAGESLQPSLQQAAAFAARICLVEGAFGAGMRY